MSTELKAPPCSACGANPYPCSNCGAAPTVAECGPREVQVECRPCGYYVRRGAVQGDWTMDELRVKAIAAWNEMNGPSSRAAPPKVKLPIVRPEDLVLGKRYLVRHWRDGLSCRDDVATYTRPEECNSCWLVCDERLISPVDALTWGIWGPIEFELEGEPPCQK